MDIPDFKKDRQSISIRSTTHIIGQGRQRQTSSTSEATAQKALTANQDAIFTTEAASQIYRHVTPSKSLRLLTNLK
jgi:hypothetical protein